MSTLFSSTHTQPLILEILDRHNWFEPKRFSELTELVGKTSPGNPPEAILIRGGYISDREVASLYVEDLFLPEISGDLLTAEVDKDLAGLLPEKLCFDKLICPMAVRGDWLDVAFVSPEEMGVIDELELLTGMRVNPLIAPLSVV